MGGKFLNKKQYTKKILLSQTDISFGKNMIINPTVSWKSIHKYQNWIYIFSLGTSGIVLLMKSSMKEGGISRRYS